MFVQEDRNPEFVPDSFAETTGQVYAVLHRCALEGDKGHYVRGSDAGVDALMPAEIDSFGGGANGLKRGFLNGPGLAGKSQDRPMVVGIACVVQQPDVRYGLHRRRQSVEGGLVTAFAEVGDTLDELRHHRVIDRK